MTTHARPPLAVRLADLLRGHRRIPDPPDLVPMRTVDYGDGPKIIGFRHEGPVRPPTWGAARWDHPAPRPAESGPVTYDTGRDDEQAGSMDPGSHDHPAWIEAPRSGHPEPHPPWLTAPQPTLTGPGALGTFYAAENLRDQQEPAPAGAYADNAADDHSIWWGMTRMDLPAAHPPRRYVPEPEPEPEPAWYPPLDLRADLAECQIFRGAVRDQLVRQERARGNHPAGPWLQVYADVFERRITPGALT